MQVAAVAEREVERYRRVARGLHEVARPMRVLSALRWPPPVRAAFLDGGAQALPSVEHPPFDELPVVEAVQEIRRSIYPVGWSTTGWSRSPTRSRTRPGCWPRAARRRS